MRGNLAYPYSDSLLEYEFKPEHPLKPDRLKLTYLLSKAVGLLDDVKLIEPIPATRDEIEMFHSPEFVDAVIRVGETLGIEAQYGLGIPDNPVFPGIYDAAARYAGATLQGMKAIIDGASNAFCISGGLHHAAKSEASGFCIFNDIVLAIKLLLKKKPCKVLYFDFDAHHGDGVQNAFYRSKEVLTISVHQSGKTLFPGTGFVYEAGGGDGMGNSVNVPLIPGASSTELIRVYEEVVTPLFESFKPDLLVTQLGVDAHFLDPLANLAYTSYGYETVVKRLRDMSNDICDIGWLALGGGGYHPVNVARLWTLFLSIILDKKIPEKLPDDFKQTCYDMGYSKFPETFRDKDEVVQLYFSPDQINLDLDRTIRLIKETIFPYHGL
jgi:acetoin utilization protein AcuC